ncbi:MAG: phosphoenolpyruvate--protein phosphotransferase [Treponema sp.]|jgi:phosphotransferase system enzyme I (PtsI)|nr:phosphoenolpyruvate--protein phosphotransferase [Treponema sp.]
MKLTGQGVSSGIAVGKIHVYSCYRPEPEESFCLPGEEQEQWNRYEEVRKKALAELDAVRANLEKNDPEEAKIFTAHQDIVDDVAINEEISGKILNQRWSGDWAVFAVYEQFLRMIRRVKDPLIAQRSADFEDVRKRLLRIWYNRNDDGAVNLKSPAIIAAHDLLPSDTAALDRNMVQAILAETGGPASHSAIIAKSYGIPAVLGIPELLASVTGGRLAAVDADEGSVLLDPDEDTVRDFQRREKIYRRSRETAASYLKKDAFTADRVRIDVGLNIAGGEELEAADYADSVGLFRTEFLYMGRDTLPSEEEQLAVYEKILKRFGRRPVTLRTLDIGGDKTLDSMRLPKEDNPFLGNRALRLCLSRPDVFRTQIRACLRASAHGNLWIMFPMVGSVDDILAAKDFINTVRKEIEREGHACGTYKTGVMIEVPSIALIADKAAAEVDFASIGSNDLCQYICAADRMNPSVADYYQSYHPGLFRLIGETVKAFAEAGKPLCICGELGGDPLAVPALAGLGMRKFSMGSASLGRIKQTLADITLPRAEELARAVLRCASAGEVERRLKQFAAGNGEQEKADV